VLPEESNNAPQEPPETPSLLLSSEIARDMDAEDAGIDKGVDSAFPSVSSNEMDHTAVTQTASGGHDPTAVEDNTPTKSDTYLADDADLAEIELGLRPNTEEPLSPEQLQEQTFTPIQKNSTLGELSGTVNQQVAIEEAIGLFSLSSIVQSNVQHLIFFSK
jgi:hypothetical protein